MVLVLNHREKKMKKKYKKKGEDKEDEKKDKRERERERDRWDSFKPTGQRRIVPNAESRRWMEN